MSDNPAETPAQPAQPEQPAPTRQPLRISDRQLTTHYVNAFRTQSSAEEVILDLGLNRAELFPPQQPGGTPVQGIALDLSARVVMNWRNAKRLSEDLGKAVAAWEKQFGQIQNTPPNG